MSESRRCALIPPEPSPIEHDEHPDSDLEPDHAEDPDEAVTGRPDPAAGDDQPYD